MISNKFELAVIILLIMIVVLLFFIMLDGYDTASKLAEVMTFLEDVVVVDINHE